MPNHVTNRIIAEPEILQRIGDAFRGHGEQLVDFNRLIPSPDGMEGSNYPAIESRAKVILGIRPLKEILQGQQRMAVGRQSYGDVMVSQGLQAFEDSNTLRDLFEGEHVKDWDDERFETLIRYLRNLRTYACADWYTWNQKNWGTKWNAYDAKVEADAITFDTAWSCPVPIVARLAALRIGAWTWEYADEDIGHNCGVWTANQDGSIVHADFEDPVRFACQIKGYDYEEYMTDHEELAP